MPNTRVSEATKTTISKIKATLLLAALFFIAGCIYVKDFGEYWEKGLIDEKIEGNWINPSGKMCVTLEREGDYYNYFLNGELKHYVKTVDFVPKRYLMLKPLNPDHTGMLMNYAIVEDSLVFYLPDKNRSHEFGFKYRNKNIIVSRNNITITKLDDEVAKIMAEIADKSHYWEYKMHLYKIENDCAELMNNQKRKLNLGE